MADTPDEEECSKQEQEETDLVMNIDGADDLDVVTDDHHEFSSPWDDSDLVLIVEDQKLHVHSLILKMASPVFKAMLSSDFKEKNEKEISLPEKEADEFVDLLRQIYPQFTKYKIDLSNMEHIYQLADEYQMERVAEACRKTLETTKISRRNAVEMLVLAEKIKSDEVRQQCYKIMKKMTVAELIRNEDFQDLGEQSLRDVLLPKAERLEECLRKIQPQFVGLLDCVMYFWLHSDNTKCIMRGRPTRCPVHAHVSYSSVASVPITTRLGCQVCKRGFIDMSQCSRDGKNTPYYSRSGMYFDDNIVRILQEMFDLLT